MAWLQTKLSIFWEKNMLNKKICVIGLGYIGLPTSALIASKNFLVNGFDINSKVLNDIKV